MPIFFKFLKIVANEKYRRHESSFNCCDLWATKCDMRNRQAGTWACKSMHLTSDDSYIITVDTVCIIENIRDSIHVERCVFKQMRFAWVYTIQASDIRKNEWNKEANERNERRTEEQRIHNNND